MQSTGRHEILITECIMVWYRWLLICYLLIFYVTAKRRRTTERRPQAQALITFGGGGGGGGKINHGYLLGTLTDEGVEKEERSVCFICVCVDSTQIMALKLFILFQFPSLNSVAKKNYSWAEKCWRVTVPLFHPLSKCINSSTIFAVHNRTFG
jgi:hypothetical protein